MCLWFGMVLTVSGCFGLIVIMFRGVSYFSSLGVLVLL